MEPNAIINVGFTKGTVISFVREFQAGHIKLLALAVYCAAILIQPVATWSIAKSVEKLVGGDLTLILTICAIYIVLAILFLLSWFRALLVSDDERKGAHWLEKSFEVIFMLEQAAGDTKQDVRRRKNNVNEGARTLQTLDRMQTELQRLLRGVLQEGSTLYASCYFFSLLVLTIALWTAILWFFLIDFGKCCDKSEL
jgi:hypothetical protein